MAKNLSEFSDKAVLVLEQSEAQKNESKQVQEGVFFILYRGHKSHQGNLIKIASMVAYVGWGTGR